MPTGTNNRRYNRQFSLTSPIMYQGKEYPSTDALVYDDRGNKVGGKIFTDANGLYYSLDASGNALPAIQQYELPEVVVTAPRENLLSKQFNDYLAINRNDATYVAKPLMPKPIKPDLSFDAALKRAVKPYSNYSEALDAPFSKWKEILVNGARYIKDNYMSNFPTGASNCTLSATQWINPTNPVNRAASIVNEPAKFNYEEIDSASTLPGDLLIAKVPDKESYHSMLITGFANKNGKKYFRGKSYDVKKGEPLLTYSRGGNSLNNIQSNIPLSVYTENSDGHTENLFFRYKDPYNVLLPEVIIKAKRK